MTSCDCPDTARHHSSNGTEEWYSGALSLGTEEEDVKKAILLAIGGLMLLAGCSSPADKGAGIPIGPKWKGAPYRLTFAAQTDKPNPAVFTIPAVKFTANPDGLETRAVLVVRFDPDATEASKKGTVVNQEILAPFDIKGTEGTIPADYMDRASKGMSTLLGAYCIKGKVKISVALARSSVNPQAGDAALNGKLLSDWQSVEVTYKNPHPKC